MALMLLHTRMNATPHGQRRNGVLCTALTIVLIVLHIVVVTFVIDTNSTRHISRRGWHGRWRRQTLGDTRCRMGDRDRTGLSRGMDVGLMDTVTRLSDGCTSGNLAGGSVQAGLDEILALGLGDEGLELGSRKRIHETGLGHDEQEDLSAGEG